MLVETSDRRPEPPEDSGGQRPRFGVEHWRSWRSLAIGAVLLVVSTTMNGAVSLIPVLVATAFVMDGATSFYAGRDGLSKNRQ